MHRPIIFITPALLIPPKTASLTSHYCGLLQSLKLSPDFQHILRVLNTNIDGKRNVQFALTSIKGVGRRFSNIVCKKAEVDTTKR